MSALREVIDVEKARLRCCGLFSKAARGVVSQRRPLSLGNYAETRVPEIVRDPQSVFELIVEWQF